MSKVWFASDSFEDGSSPLVSPTNHGSDNPTFRDAQPITIEVDQVWVRDDRDGWGKGDNDLIITTRHRVGERPLVDKVHFLRKDVPEREQVGDFFHPIVFATDDFREVWEEVTIQVRVFDQDGLSNDEEAVLSQAIQGAGGAAAIAFPHFAPIAGLASGAGNALVGLVNGLDDHDEILDARIRLAVNEPANRGWSHLQPGFLIFFAEDVNAEGLVLAEDRHVRYEADDGTLQPWGQYSYAVLRVSRRLIPTPDLALNQRMATLLAEIESGRGQTGTRALDFLKSTFEAFANFRKLERIAELEAKDERSEEEEELLGSLRGEAALAPFLP